MFDFQDFYTRIRQLKLHSSRLVEGLYSGNYRSVFRGPGLEFDEVREYDPMDDARFIDWNVSSRMGSPYTKKFREERELSLTIIADISPSLDSGSGRYNKREILNSLFANLAFAAVSTEDRVGGVFFSDKIEKWVPPRKGKTYALSLVQECLMAQATGKGSNLGLALRTAHESMKRRGIIVILSDFKTSNYWKEMSLVTKHHDVIAVRIHDPLDSEFPEGGLLELIDPETGQVVLGFGNSPTFRREYHDFWALQRLHWKRECLRRGVPVLEVGTQDDPASRLSQFFNRRERHP
ncbi:MAG: DUF58 domain-containing protein [Spirochaetales bacterium]